MLPRKKTAPIRGKAIIADTNIFVHDPGSIDRLREKGNILIIPFVVILELDRLKEKPDIGIDAREATRKIEEIQKSGDPSLIIFRNPNFKNIGDLSRNIPDHQIIATAINLKQKTKEFEFERVRLISRDRTVRILARKFEIETADYLREQITPSRHRLLDIGIPQNICFDSLSFSYAPYTHLDIEENEGIVCNNEIAAIRQTNTFQIIPDDISAVGIKPYTINGGENWHQHIALKQLLDPTIELIFLQGGAGSGKTLLALASAIEQRKSYREIIVTRPMIPLEDEDHMGFLPGDKETKMSPWLRPIFQALNVIRELSESNDKLISNLIEKNKITFEALDYIRGMTFSKTFLIIDEAQNLTPHQIKTIITRAGEKSKLVFTGDLGQIDRRRRLDERSSGLAYAIAKMRNHRSVGTTTFKETVRSKLSSLAEERL